MPNEVMRYVSNSRRGTGPLVAVAQDLPKMIVTRKAALPLEYGVRGRELQDALRAGMQKFIRGMELQGLTVIPLAEGNPRVVISDGDPDKPYGTYSVTNDLDRAAPDELIDHATGGGGASTFREPRSLEDSGGMVDYHFIGVFWAPQVSIEIAIDRAKLIAQDKASRNPTHFAGNMGSGSGIQLARN